MPASPEVQPLSKTHRNLFFYLLFGSFVLILPFLILYAAGYRFQFGESTSLISTGGIYVAAERTGAEIYIDDELVRETRAFRRAFYAQSIEPGTHRIHVQKDGHHTWVKELPVYPHLVTEAQAFNLPQVPELRIISPWRLATGETVVFDEFDLEAVVTNQLFLATTTATSSYIADTEYASIITLFNDPELPSGSSRQPFTFASSASPTKLVDLATTTKEYRGVRLYELDDQVYATYVGSRQDMPYYYCADEFELIGTSTAPMLNEPIDALSANTAQLLDPVQTVPEDVVCDPVIWMNNHGQDIISFDFYPGSSDFIVWALEDGVYMQEIDDRAWQNTQPILLGDNLDVRVDNGQVYVYDGNLIYHVETEA